jgi:hypothetical protein
VDDSVPSFHSRFGRESFATFAGDFVVRFMLMDVVCHTASWLMFVSENRSREKGVINERVLGEGPLCQNLRRVAKLLR